MSEYSFFEVYVASVLLVSVMYFITRFVSWAVPSREGTLFHKWGKTLIALLLVGFLVAWLVVILS